MNLTLGLAIPAERTKCACQTLAQASTAEYVGPGPANSLAPSGKSLGVLSGLIKQSGVYAEQSRVCPGGCRHLLTEANGVPEIACLPDEAQSVGKREFAPARGRWFRYPHNVGLQLRPGAAVERRRDGRIACSLVEYEVQRPAAASPC